MEGRSNNGRQFARSIVATNGWWVALFFFFVFFVFFLFVARRARAHARTLRVALPRIQHSHRGEIIVVIFVAKWAQTFWRACSFFRVFFCRVTFFCVFFFFFCQRVYEAARSMSKFEDEDIDSNAATLTMTSSFFLCDDVNNAVAKIFFHLDFSFFEYFFKK